MYNLNWAKKMKEGEDLMDCVKLLSKNNYHSEVIKEILKWYDCTEKKGIASFQGPKKTYKKRKIPNRQQVVASIKLSSFYSPVPLGN